MAPEIYLNKPYGSSVDIYSLGLVLYKFMNNNRLPFFPLYPQPITFADRENALSRRMKGDNPSAPVNACKEFADIILKACAYNPEERYRTAADMLEDVRRLRIHLVTAAEAEALSNKQENLIPPMASNTPFSQENDAVQTQGIFEEISNEETIGLWNMEVATGNDIIDNISDLDDITPIDEEAHPPIHKAEDDKPLEKVPRETHKKKKGKLIASLAIALIMIIAVFTGVYLYPQREETYPLRKIDSLMAKSDFNDAIEYITDNEELLKSLNSGWVQNGKLLLSETYDSDSPVIFFENNSDNNSFYMFSGIYDSNKKRNGEGLEIKFYYTSGNYYYANGTWTDDVLARGHATSQTIEHNFIYKRSGLIKNNMFYDYIIIDTISPSGYKKCDKMPVNFEKSYLIDE